MIYNNVSEFNEDELKVAMKLEKDSIDSFDVKDEILVQDVSEEVRQSAMSLTWVHVWKGFVESRLCVRVYAQTINDLDDTYASTPMVYMLRILLLLALLLGYSIQLFDISTAFLHATLKSETPIYVWPPREF